MRNNPSPHSPRPSRAPHLLAGIGLLAVLCLAGCSSSTDPGPEPDPPVTIGFHPADQVETLKLGETRVFYATVQPAGPLAVNWYRDGRLAGRDTAFTFVPSAVGRDTLEVGALAGSVRDTFFWIIDVEKDPVVVPPEVPGVDAVAGPGPADVVVSWRRVTGAAFPLVEYLVAVSYTGPINADNWEQAASLGRYDSVPGQLGYTRTYTEAADGMRPGQQAWFAVRVRDDRQQLSPLTGSSRLDITWPWFLGGRVADDAGLPLLGVIVSSSGPGYLANTDGSGHFLFDLPFRNIDSIRVGTASPSWYDFLGAPVSVARETTYTAIVLINKYGLGYDCYNGDFLVFLRDMTRTNTVVGQPGNSILHKWEQYPLTVFIPPMVNSEGVDMEAASLAAMDFWNTTMREDALALGIEETDYFVRTADEAAADIVFLFEYRSQNYGEVSLLLPQGTDSELGRVIPEKMQIWINTDPALDLFDEVQGVALHEFGHTLGMFAHADCPVSEYLMKPAGGILAMGHAAPIHPDERRVVRAIRNLREGTEMSDFTAGKAGSGLR